ncbi:MAG TPA: glycosyltransferase family 4 protein [Nitrososphaerales archaeon]|nr:glycosyltransferase family 4 protein [Nitrososphaerales archaeon]
MKIAVVTETFAPFRGGSAKRYLEVFKRIAAQGHQVHLYTARLQNDDPAEEEVDGIQVHRTPAYLRGFISDDGLRSVIQVFRFSYWAFTRLVKDGPFDIIEANHCPIFPAQAAWLYSKSTRRAISVTFHEVWQRRWSNYVSHGLQAPVGYILERTLARIPDGAVAVSNYTARHMATELGVDQSKTVVIQNGVDKEKFDTIEERDRGCIIYTGRINPHKRIDLLLEAYVHLSSLRNGIRLEIVGDGPLLDTWVRYVESNGLKNVTFCGALEDEELARHLERAYVYVLPSIREGQSITTLEAMAAGTPQVVMIADGTAASSLVMDAGSGLAVPPDPERIAEAIESLLIDEQAWRRLSASGKKYASELTWNDAARKHIELYEQIINNRAK